MTGRLIEQAAVQQRLIRAIAAQPAGKLHLGKVRSALLSQNDIVRAISMLVEVGKLDAVTLRPPAKPKPDRRGFTLADGVKARPLFDQVKAECDRRRIQLQRASIEIFDSRSGLWRLAGDIETVRQRTADKVTHWLNRSKCEPDGAPGTPTGKGKASLSAVEIVAEIEAFIASGAMTQTQFTRRCLRSDGTMPRMRKPGATVKPTTVERIRTFIAEHAKPAPAAAADIPETNPVEPARQKAAPASTAPPAAPRAWSDVEPRQLLHEIRKFCEAQHRTLTGFGRAAVGDPALARRLEKVDSVTVQVVAKVRSYIAEQSKLPATPEPSAIEVKGVVGLAPTAREPGEPPERTTPMATFLQPSEVAWCVQCERRVRGLEAGRCTSLWCGLKVKAA